MIKSRRPADSPARKNVNVMYINHSTPSAGEKVAYLSIPSKWSDEIKDQVLGRVRNDLPDLRIESFKSAFTLSELLADPSIWGDLIRNFIAGTAALIVATDSTRVVGVGIKHEIQMALRARKPVIIYDVTRGCCARFFGYDPHAGDTIRLRDRAMTEQEKAERKERRRLKKRLKESRRRKRRKEERQSISIAAGRKGSDDAS
jgi:hypothetical protein